MRIIHFCLGASKDDYKEFCEKLPGWEFYLDFEIENTNIAKGRQIIIEFLNGRFIG